jgi:hypothetical protein
MPSEKETQGLMPAKSENKQPVGAKDDLCGATLFPDRLLA